MRTVLLDRETGAVEEVVVVLSTDEVVVRQRTVDVVREGQPPIMGEEFELVEEILWADEALVRGDGAARADRRRNGSGSPRSSAG